MQFPGNTGADCHFPIPGDLPDPGIKCASSPALAGGFFTTSATSEHVLYGKLQWKLGKPPTIGGTVTAN